VYLWARFSKTFITDLLRWLFLQMKSRENIRDC